MSELTLDEKLSLVYGDGAFGTHGIPRLGIPPVMMADGPRGVRMEDGRRATCMPCGVSLASTFSVKDAEEYGAIIGGEALEFGFHVLLGPGVNLTRSPLCGRTFEYFGEDPVLSGLVAAGYIRGVQSTGCAACLKHFALNNQEACRRVTSANVDEGTMRDLYLRPFEIAVRKGNPWSVMCSYNRVNGVFASENEFLQRRILRDEWGSDALMVSDWGAVHGAYRAAMNGMDLEMAGGDGAFFNRPLRRMVEQGLVPEEVIDEKVYRLLLLMERTGLIGSRRSSGKIVPVSERRRAAKRIAQDGMVLLKNDNDVLPLDRKSLRRIAVIGPSADFAHEIGAFRHCGGSGSCHPEYEVTPLAGLRELIGGDVEISYAPGEMFEHASLVPPDCLVAADGRRGLDVEYFRNNSELDDPEAVPMLCSVDERIDYMWGRADNIALSGDTSEIDRLAFGVRWTGWFVPQTDGRTELYFTYPKVWQGTPVVSLRLDGKTVLDSREEGFNQDLSRYSFDARKGERRFIEIEFRRIRPDVIVSFRLNCRSDAAAMRARAVEMVRGCDAVLYFGGSNHMLDKEAVGGAEFDGDMKSYSLPGAQYELVDELLKVCPKVIVCLIGGTTLDIEPFADRVPAILQCWYPGMEGGRAIAEVLFGDAYPGGRLCCTWARRLEDHACHALGLFPGDTDPYIANSDYLEGVFIGYRHFDAAMIQPRYPFGFGLGYTTMEYSLKDISCRNGAIEACVEARNSGRRRGSAVVQAYVRNASCVKLAPEKELGGFGRIDLDPGESGMLRIVLDEEVFRHASTAGGSSNGIYEIRFGTSSRDIFAAREVELN
ncbi:MAG: glycoside hydrolase family 3 C-terminal domain-containing protein [Victivallaceae bacterium]|nr:glycoside hydrolase family 3 C-terminal domain-containing protein [Victivallaceae bacterium]